MKKDPQRDRLLTVAQVAELLNTSERFPRRLIEERRITFVRLGRNVPIPCIPSSLTSADAGYTGHRTYPWTADMGGESR